MNWRGSSSGSGSDSSSGLVGIEVRENGRPPGHWSFLQLPN